MTNNEVKKALYKEKPIAFQVFKDEQRASYICSLSNPNGEVLFNIPLSDAVGANLQDTMPSQLLIRWIDEFYPVN